MEDQTGLNRELALQLRDQYGLKYFIETGTYRGESALWAADNFKSVVTIEKDPRRFHKVAGSMSRRDNVKMLLGDSRVLLFTALRDVRSSALIYLDAHLAGYTKNGWINDDQCPLKEELHGISQIRIGHVIIIDDANWFIGEPEFEYDPEQFIRLDEIKKILRDHDVTKVNGWNCLLCLPRIKYE